MPVNEAGFWADSGRIEKLIPAADNGANIYDYYGLTQAQRSQILVPLFPRHLWGKTAPANTPFQVMRESTWADDKRSAGWTAEDFIRNGHALKGDDFTNALRPFKAISDKHKLRQYSYPEKGDFLLYPVQQADGTWAPQSFPSSITPKYSFNLENDVLMQWAPISFPIANTNDTNTAIRFTNIYNFQFNDPLVNPINTQTIYAARTGATAEVSVQVENGEFVSAEIHAKGSRYPVPQSQAIETFVSSISVREKDTDTKLEGQYTKVAITGSILNRLIEGTSLAPNADDDKVMYYQDVQKDQVFTSRLGINVFAKTEAKAFEPFELYTKEGSGAILVPTIDEGKIVDFEIKQGGMNYTNDVDLQGSGSGAEVKINVAPITFNDPTELGSGAVAYGNLLRHNRVLRYCLATVRLTIHLPASD